jgi:cholesterol transport system auxiliary component
MRASNEISVYQGVRWSDPAPVLLRNRLVDMFTQDASIASLSTDDSNLQADLELSSDLRSFQVEYQNGVPVVMIKLDARLVQTASRRIVAARSFDVRQTVEGTKVPEVVVAFGKATDTLAGQVRDWTLRQGSASLATSRAIPPP